jgi:hypothetical protein
MCVDVSPAYFEGDFFDSLAGFSAVVEEVAGASESGESASAN